MEALLIALVALGVLIGIPTYLGFRAGLRHGMALLTNATLSQFDAELVRGQLPELTAALRSRYSILRAEGPHRVGRVLANLGISSGTHIGQTMQQPPKGEVNVTMPLEYFRDIAWLADYGLRVWITPSDDHGLRYGERVTKERAQRLANTIETLERKAANWPQETEEEKEQRFDRSENLMHRIWDAYDARERPA